MKTIPTSLFVFGLLGFVAVLNSCSGSQAAHSAPAAEVVEVTLATPSASAGGQVQLSGKLESENTATISTRVMGYIASVPVKIGDRVAKGQVLATINSQDIYAKKAQTQAMITSAEAAFKNAAKDYERFRTLYAQQSVSAKEFENVSLQYEGAKSSLEAARQMLNEVNAMLQYTHIKAPFAGVVTQKMADAGSMANPGMPLLMLEQHGNLRVSATVSESDVTALHTGDAATVQLKSTGKVCKGTITEMSPSSQYSGGQYAVKISIPAGDQKGLLSGMYVRVLVDGAATASSATGVRVPLSSLIRRDQLTGVYVVSDQHIATLRWIRLGKLSDTDAEVLSGLNAQEHYVLKAKGKLYNGVVVRVTP